MYTQCSFGINKKSRNSQGKLQNIKKILQEKNGTRANYGTLSSRRNNEKFFH